MKRILASVLSASLLFLNPVPISASCCGGGGLIKSPVPLNRIPLEFEVFSPFHPNGGSGSDPSLTWNGEANGPGGWQSVAGGNISTAYKSVEFRVPPNATELRLTVTGAYSGYSDNVPFTITGGLFDCLTNQPAVSPYTTTIPFFTGPPAETSASLVPTASNGIPGGDDVIGGLRAWISGTGEPQFFVDLSYSGCDCTDENCPEDSAYSSTPNMASPSTSDVRFKMGPGSWKAEGLNGGGDKQFVSPSAVMDVLTNPSSSGGGYDLKTFARSSFANVTPNNVVVTSGATPVVIHRIRPGGAGVMTVSEEYPGTAVPVTGYKFIKVADDPSTPNRHEWKMQRYVVGGNGVEPVREDRLISMTDNGIETNLIREIVQLSPAEKKLRRYEQILADGKVTGEIRGFAGVAGVPDAQKTTTHYYSAAGVYEGFSTDHGDWQVIRSESGGDSFYTPKPGSILARPLPQDLDGGAATEVRKVFQSRDGASVTSTEYLGNVEVSTHSSASSCAVPGFPDISSSVSTRTAPDGSLRVSTSYRYRRSANVPGAGRPAGFMHSDGSARAHYYYRGTFVGETFEESPTGDHLMTLTISGKLAPGQNILTQSPAQALNSFTIENAAGQKVYEQSSVGTVTTYTRNPDGRPTSVVIGGQTVANAVWNGPRIASKTDGVGTTQTFFNHNADHQPTQVLTAGFAGAGADAPARPGSQLDQAMDALGRIIAEESREAGVTTIQAGAKRIYDALGRMTSEKKNKGVTVGGVTSPGVETTTAYAVDAATGRNTVTVTRPGGITSIREFSRDGSLVSSGGSGEIAESKTYATEAVQNGPALIKVTTVRGAGAETVWREVFTDSLGRVVREESQRPGFPNERIVRSTEYDGKDRVLKEFTNGSLLREYVYDDDFDKITTRTYLDATNFVETWRKVSGQGSEVVTVETESGWSVSYQGGGYADPFYGWVTSYQLNYSVDTLHFFMSGQIYSLDRATGLQTTFGFRSDAINHSIQKVRHGVVESTTGHDGVAATVYSYDGLGRVKTHRDGATGAITTFAYSNPSFPSQQTSGTTANQGLSSVSTSTYISPGAANAGMVESSTVNGQTTIYVYTARGELERSSGASYPVKYQYDALGRMKHMWTFRDAPNGDWSNGQITTWNYDNGSGALISKADAQNKAVTYTYDAMGRLGTRTWARGNKTVYTRDLVGRVVATVYIQANGSGDPNTAGFELHSPDFKGRYQGRLDGFGWHTIQHDVGPTSTHNVVTTAYQWGTQLMTELFADSYGRLAQVRVRKMSTGVETFLDQTYTYDASTGGRLWNIMEAGSQMSATYTFNPATPLVETVTTSAGTTLLAMTRTHDALGRLQSVATNYSAAGLPATPIESHTFGYDAQNRRDTDTLLDGTSWDYDYNDRNEVIGGTRKLPAPQNNTAMNGWQFGYNFDAIGNRTSTSTNGRTAAYTENGKSLNQYATHQIPRAVDIVGEKQPGTSAVLIRRTQPQPAETANSQPTEATIQANKYFHRAVPINTADATEVEVDITGFNAAANQQSPLGTRKLPVPFRPETETYTYDDDGNLTADGLWEYTWDGENRLIAQQTRRINGQWVLPAASRKRLTFQYDWMSRRVNKTVSVWAGELNGEPIWNTTVNRNFVWVGWAMLAELDGMVNNGPDFYGALLRRYIWGKDLSGSLEGAGGVGGLLAVEQITYQQGGNINSPWLTKKLTFPVYDGNGNVMKYLRAVPDANGNFIEAEFAYGPFGEAIRATGLWGENPIRWSTKYVDEETGLAYYGYRYYDPSTGRWISRDPLEEEGGVNLSAFVQNSTIEQYDDKGMLPGEHKGEWSGMPGNSWFVPHDSEMPRVNYVAGNPDFRGVAKYVVVIPGCGVDRKADIRNAINALGANYTKITDGEWHHFSRNGVIEMQYVSGRIHRFHRHTGTVGVMGQLAVQGQISFRRNGLYGVTSAGGSVRGVPAGGVQNIGNAAMLLNEAVGWYDLYNRTKNAEEIEKAVADITQSYASDYRFRGKVCLVIEMIHYWQVPGRIVRPVFGNPYYLPPDRAAGYASKKITNVYTTDAPCSEYKEQDILADGTFTSGVKLIDL